MSLRARLLAVLLALAALGLITLAAVTYAEQRSFLNQRVDDQTRAAIPAISHQLEPEHARGGFGPPPGAPGAPGPPDGGPGADVSLPPGTYGQRRDASGKVVGTAVITYGQSAPPAPKLPTDIPVGERITVSAVSGSELHYRVLAVPSRDGAGTTIVAIPL